MVAWRIRQYAWKVQRWTRVVGQMFLHALAKPLPPSVMTRAGGAIRLMIGSLSDEHHGASAQVDTIDEDDVMNLIDDWAERP